MWKRYRTVSERLWVVVDTALCVVSFFAALGIRSAPGTDRWFEPIDPILGYVPVLYVLVPVFAVVRAAFIRYLGGARTRRATVLRVTAFNAAAVGAVAAVLYVAKFYALNRTLVVLFGPANVLLMCLARSAAGRVEGDGRRLVIIAGRAGVGMAESLGVSEARVVGYVRVEGDADDDGRLPVLGSVEDIGDILAKHPVDELLVPMRSSAAAALPVLVDACVKAGIGCRLAMRDLLPSAGTLQVDDGGSGSVVIERRAVSSGTLAVKQALDYVLSAAALLILSPVLGLIAVAIKLDTTGPVIFRQKRVGLNGREFVCYKFRSMVENAAELRRGLEDRNQMTGGGLFKMDGDPRVTRVGRVLRRLSLDELPQLLNVLKGEMSLIGPRAVSTPIEAYSPAERRRLRMKPGLSCLWQVRRRWDVDHAAWMEADLEYVDRWSLALDAWILLWTLWIVLRMQGAR
jgi:exopolysaccharide biosynthesis polyprenyl glycosylphosphotransferase